MDENSKVKVFLKNIYDGAQIIKINPNEKSGKKVAKEFEILFASFGFDSFNFFLKVI